MDNSINGIHLAFALGGAIVGLAIGLWYGWLWFGGHDKEGVGK